MMPSWRCCTTEDILESLRLQSNEAKMKNARQNGRAHVLVGASFDTESEVQPRHKTETVTWQM